MEPDRAIKNIQNLANGNLTGDGRFTYTWDAENRLVAVEELVCPTNRSLRRVEYAYDHQSRRVARREYTLGNSQWQLEATSAFIYDGWNLVAETIQHQQTTVTNLYVWGLDLSNSRQGAGGIGGLLAAALATNETQTVGATYGYDGNGNVSVVAVGGNSEPFTLATSLKYDPFGRAIAQRTTPGHEPLAAANPFRFSTKWFDNATGLGYWGYRWYSPGMGRWLNRDPIGEHVFVNHKKMFAAASLNEQMEMHLTWLVVISKRQPPEDMNAYHYCWNSPADRRDYLGLSNEWTHRGRCCNRSNGDEWALVSEGEGPATKCYWKKLAPGECVGGFFSGKDCEGMTCGGGFYVVKPYDLTGECKTPGCDRGPYKRRRWAPNPGDGDKGSQPPESRCKGCGNTPPDYQYGPRKKCCSDK